MLLSCRRRVSSSVSSSSSETSSAAARMPLIENASSSSSFRYAAVSLLVGFAAGRLSFRTPEENARIEQLPKGYPLACCADHETSGSSHSHSHSHWHSAESTRCEIPDLAPEHQKLVKALRRIVGNKQFLDGREQTTETASYLKGARLGRGSALAIVRPTKLRQVQEIVQETVDAGCVVLVQGSNTGLTGGSVPREQTDGRPTVVISMKHFDTVFPIDDGERVVCLAGVGLASLKHFVIENFPDRESHSILGSTFLNPTTAAGVAYGSGGTQSRKGPACTERALYLKVTPDKYGKSIVKVVNTLGIEDLDCEEGEFEAHKRWDGVITKLDSYIDVVKNESDNVMKSSNDTYGKHQSHDQNYKDNLCKLDHNVSRFNADTKGLDCNRSEGKVLILATVHDTFESPRSSKSFWLSFEDLETANKFKTEVCLDNPADLPISLEYMDRDSFDIIDQAGRFMGHFIKFFGSASPIVSSAWDLKLKVEALDIRGAATFPDAFQYFFNSLLPSILPKQIMEMGRSRDHHIATTIGDYNGSLDRFEERFANFRKVHKGKIDVHECKTAAEKDGVTAFRFIAAAAFKTYCVGTGLQGFSVDYALPKNYSSSPPLPPSNEPVKRMRYSHFACNVVHEDLAYAQGIDTHAAKMELKEVVDVVCKGRLPAEHGHGTEYKAPEDTKKRWMKMDPLNVMNPGVGGLSTKYGYEKE
eukprot:CAMPEP_0197196522 /NCGR_PEP_ID=MMETSP1423-20130617/32402_1 /TAXON_ID=476441 /ORGANISM="Pseudo-nitzschia heimii, Strain UNC1101" /LENGTH=700 /DNA_ID=CAMNT_0042650327 /DNA_START=186 /DNA_END=2288 /DNA_ORIENTATION=-